MPEVTLDGRLRDTKCLADLGMGEAAEVTELDDVGLAGVAGIVCIAWCISPAPPAFFTIGGW